MKHPLLLAAATALLSLSSQAQINPNVGTPQGATDDSVAGPLALSFPFSFPGGSSTTSIFADSNGRIGASSIGSDFTESLGEFLNIGTPLIAAYWDDLNPRGGSSIGDIFFNDLGTSALVTWQDVVLFGGPSGSEFTVQLELFPDDSFKIRVDARAPLPLTNDGLIGGSPGGGVADPGEVDLSAGASSNGSPVVYELFNNGTNDIVNGELCFTPDGLGGYDVISTVVAPVPSQVTDLGPGCNTVLDVMLRFVPNGTGGYTVSQGGVADTAFASGAAVALGDDSSSVQPLGFSFTMPGGTVVTDIELESNGRLFEVGQAASDAFPTTGKFLGDPTALVAPLWADFDPSSGGQVWVHSTATGVSVTWDQVPEFNTANSNTFQVQLNSDDSIVFAYLGVDADSGIVGTSPGSNLSFASERDLTAGFSSGAEAAAYELFEGDLDLRFVPPVLEITGAPVLGSTFRLDILSATRLVDFYLVGNASNVDLSPIGVVGCSFLSDGVLATVMQPLGMSFNVNVPVIPTLIGLSVTAQGAVLDPTAQNPLLLLTTNGLDLQFGDF